MTVRLPGKRSRKNTSERNEMYLIESKEGKTWKKEPITFDRLDAAEKYAEELYKEGKTVRVVDERYRK